jgi:hypothetical protein
MPNASGISQLKNLMTGLLARWGSLHSPQPTSSLLSHLKIGASPMKTAALLSAAGFVAVLVSGTALAQQSTVSAIYGSLPSITPYEKACVLAFSTPTELRTCITKMPSTAFYQRERERSLARLDQLSAIAADLRSGDSAGPLDDPWFKFCLQNETPQCLDACLNGWVCSSQ